MSKKEPVSSGGLKKFRLMYKNSVLKILCDKNLRAVAGRELERNYSLLENYILENPFFLSSYEPVDVDETAPNIVKIMTESTKKVGVGQMAAVAGAFSEVICDFLLGNGAKEVIVDNGGDICLNLRRERVIGVYAGTSAFSERIGFRITPDLGKIGICTSSSSVGHSVSLGDSDAVTVIADSCPLADAAATAIGNEVKGKQGIKNGIKRAKKISGIEGVLIVIDDEMGCWGNLPEIIRI
ncbi:MAG TPA: UPF0280 family protein [Candidatus Altiarchaeales archaeon]|nr:UPF0280 family protein [Candidatus Altiarchaeales archaeon]